MRQLVHTMFISNNRALFHLWWKENLVKHQNVWKYYENDCRFEWSILLILSLKVKSVESRFLDWKTTFKLKDGTFFLRQQWILFSILNGYSRIIIFIFWDFFFFFQIFFSPQVKRWANITYKHGIYKLPHEWPNDLRFRKLRNIRKVLKPHRIVAHRLVPPPKWKPRLPILAKCSWKTEIKPFP